MTVNNRRSLFSRLLAVHLVLLGAAAMNAAWAEDAAPASTSKGKSESGPKGSAPTNGSEKAKSDEHAGDKIDSSSGGMGEDHAGSRDRAKGGEETDSRGVWHGEDHTGVKHNGTESNPIDTRITVFGRPRSGHALNARDRKQTKIARPSGISDHRRTLIHANKDHVVRNAIGQPVQVKADSKGTDKKVLRRLLLRALRRAWCGGKWRRGRWCAGPAASRVCPASGPGRQTARPTAQHCPEPFDHQRHRHGPSGVAHRRNRWLDKKSIGCP